MDQKAIAHGPESGKEIQEQKGTRKVANYKGREVMRREKRMEGYGT